MTEQKKDADAAPRAKTALPGFGGSKVNANYLMN